jgi:hypothetical protein
MSGCIKGISDVLPFDIVLYESFTQHECKLCKLSALLGTTLVDVYMENALAGFRSEVFSVVAPRKLLMMTSKYAVSSVFIQIAH